MRAFRHMLFVLVAAWSVVFLPAKAHAEDVYCLGNGEVGGGYFFNQSSGSGSACTLTGLDHVFSQVICSFVRILNQVLTKVYCGVQFAMIDTLSILLSVYVMIFGVQLLMGMTQLNSREIMVRLLKIAGVWMFATESQWAIGLAFNFFIDLGSSGIYWALGSIPIADLNTTCISTTNLDNLRSVMPVYAFLDRLLYCAVLAPISSAHIGILGFFLAMSIVVPPIFMLAVYWFWTVISVLMRAIISFLMGISAVAFLITLSPIFLSMMLFRATYQYFENWLRYIISYSLQIVIVFACIALWLTTVPLIIGFFSELSSVVFDASRAHSTAQVSDTTRSWGICPYKIENRPGSLAPVSVAIKLALIPF